MYIKVSLKITIIILMVGILAVPPTILQSSHAQANTEFENTILNIHNQERAEVNVPALSWSNNLAADAQIWANHLTTLGLKAGDLPPHDPSNSEGENLWMGTAGADSTAEQVQSWVAEKNNYVPGTPIPAETNEGDLVTGHYTQMVWSSTTEVGCATATGGGLAFLVCRYSPPGNFVGQVPFGPGSTASLADQGTGTSPGNTFVPADQGTGTSPGNTFVPADQGTGTSPGNTFVPAEENAGANNNGNDDGGDNNGNDDGGDNNGNDDGGDNNGNDDGGDNNGNDDGGDNNGNDDGGDNNGNDDGGDNNGNDDGGDNNGNDDQN
ncbi:CAP domain-containing protein [Candidatus Nitrosocosmicus franklandus]|uniref:Cysteine-rich secretory protein family protein (Modular protein) n=1 Tax=Candidatus Nitrosocosmicus franklandianus TaxID=1798806 RepID=A0A484ICB5_9ARCH|nr:CAP domain-containing protein [Candidatus Nitrosocosmicus franklandus]VFJ13310.1 Cysteine-rich secretory protein family protein (modular protein) [Candidatus Nitrosocosmicus franklandus]